MRAVRIGLIGAGQLSREVHGPNLTRLARAGLLEFCAVADPDPQARARWPLPGPQLLADWENLLKMDLDGVIVASPTHCHVEQASAVLQAGLALYLEKPLAPDLPSARQLAALDHGRASIGFNYREHPLHQAALRRHQGQVRHIASEFSIAPRTLSPWRKQRQAGGGVLLDLAVHHLDLVSRMVHREATWVECELESVASEDDQARIAIGFTGGATYTGQFSYRARETDRFRIAGRGETVVDRYAPWSFPLLPPWRWVGYQFARYASPWREVSFGIALRHWVAAVRGQRPFDAPLADGLRMQRLVAAAIDAAEQNRRIEL
jgi:predicted dehydrogenase